MGAVKGHFSFFTMLRLDIDEEDMRGMNARFHLVPLVGLLYGLLSGLGIYFLQGHVGMAVAVASMLLFLQLFNRFLHMDGLMDVGDGLTVSGTREDHLRALKDTRIGAGGVAFAFFVTLLAYSGLSSVPLLWLPFLPLTVEIVARNTMVATAAFGQAGSGMAGESVRLTGAGSLFKSSVLTIVLALLANGAIWLIWGWAGMQLPTIEAAVSVLAVALMASIVLGRILAGVAHRNFGIVNGDMLGASNELSRALIILLMLAVL